MTTPWTGPQYPGHQQAAPPPPAKGLRRPVIWLIVALLVLVGAGVGSWLVLRDTGDTDVATASSARGTADAFAAAANRMDVAAMAALYCERDRPTAAEIARARDAAETAGSSIHVVVTEVTETGDTAIATFAVTGSSSTDTSTTGSADGSPATETEVLIRAADGAWYLCDSATDGARVTTDTGPGGVAGPGGSAGGSNSSSSSAASSSGAASSDGN